MLLDKHSGEGIRRPKLSALRAVDKEIAEVIAARRHDEPVGCEEYHKAILDALRETDLHVYELLTREHERLQNTIQLIAAENQCSQAVLAALGSVVQNKTTEGFVGARYHGGCEVVDDIETLAVGRAKEAFDARYANVQPHSGTAANQIILTRASLTRGRRLLQRKVLRRRKLLRR